MNASLTEAFCIAIVEAASCGLVIVSTNVGGVPEVLPAHMIKLSKPTTADLIAQLEDAVKEVEAGTVDHMARHREIPEIYNWHDVAERTERVYRLILDAPHDSLFERLGKFYSIGTWSGKVFVMVVALMHVLWRVLEWASPRSHIEPALDFPVNAYQKWETDVLKSKRRP